MSFHIMLFAAAAGVAAHLGFFIRGEHHLQGPTWFKLFLWVVLVLSITLLPYSYVGVQKGAAISYSILFVHILSIYTSAIVYRIFFHKLRAFPGPSMAKATKFWHVSKVMRHSDNFRLLERLHQQYGHFVRTGPNEISVFKPEALLAVNGPGSRCTKTIWYDVLLPLVALNTTRDKTLHARRRRIWNRAFTTKALQDYEGRTKNYAFELEKRISEFAGTAINVTTWFRYYSFDVMGDFTFGHSFDMLKDGESHFAVDMLREGMAPIGPFTPVPWLFVIMKSIPGLTRGWNRMLTWCYEQLTLRLKSEVKVPDIMSWLFDASKQSNSIDADMPLLRGDATAIIIAGSDTVASALVFLFYNLTRDPQQVQKLRAEFEHLGTNVSAQALQELKHLNAVINETLRLFPPVPSGVLRNTPPEGLTIAGTYIPGDTTIIVPNYSLGRLESCFERANEFIPERWYSLPHLIRNKTAFAPFSIGTYSCVGKNLALMELRIVAFLLVNKFDISFAPGEKGVDVWEKAKDTFTLAPGDLKLVFKAR